MLRRSWPNGPRPGSPARNGSSCGPSAPWWHRAISVAVVSGRMRRVNESVRAVVAETVGGLKDPRIGLVTVTGVSVSPDLREGVVYVSVLGNEKKRKATLAGLESAHAVVQARLARELRMKRTPTLTFEYDPSVEHGVRMTKLIDDLAAELPDDDDDAD